MLILSNDRIRKTEETANAQGLSYEKMMEKAGKGCADFILSRYPYAGSVTLLCGKGRNGGDGFVCARYLAEADVEVNVIRLFASQSDALSDKKYKEMPNTVNVLQHPADCTEIVRAIKYADVIADAGFGIGFKGELPELIKKLFAVCNASNGVKIAIDLPSGLSFEQTPGAGIIKADHTLSMLALKREQVYSPFREYCGEVHIIPIGIKLNNPKAAFSLTSEEAAKLLPPRPNDSNKGFFGKALVIAGSRNMPGAAVIAANGALNSGAGLTQLAFPDACMAGVMSKLTECTFLPLSTADNGEFDPDGIKYVLSALSKCTAAAIGCGMGTGENSAEMLDAVVSSSRVPLIIDADGINILSQHKDILKKANCPVLLTPHPAEMARLTGSAVTEINDARNTAALKFAVTNNVYILLKGSSTVVASPDGRLYVNPTGCSALARGGSGDLLTGIAVSLLAQGLSPFAALCEAAFIHGKAGDIAAERFTSYAATVERIISCLPDAFLKITESL